MIRLHCDRCGRFVQGIGEPKDLSVFKKEVVCAHCTKAEDKLTRLAESLKGKFMAQVDTLVQDAKAEIKDEIGRIKASYGKED